jgi:hypothetical protein
MLVNTCRNKCGSNTACIGTWNLVDQLQCSCINSSFVSTSGNGTNCTLLVTTTSGTTNAIVSSSVQSTAPPSTTSVTRFSEPTTMSAGTNVTDEPLSSNAATVVQLGAIIGSLVGLIAIVIAIVVIWRRRSRKTHAISDTTMLQEMPLSTGPRLMKEATSRVGDGEIIFHSQLLAFNSVSVQASLKRWRWQASVSY